MKCPQCGFNSFESNDSCPKCAADLVGMKETLGIAPVVLSPARRRELAAEYAAPTAPVPAQDEPAGELFTGDHVEPAPQPEAVADPFSFIDTAASTDGTGASAAVFDDPFAALLEPTHQPSPSSPSDATGLSGDRPGQER